MLSSGFLAVLVAFALSSTPAPVVTQAPVSGTDAATTAAVPPMPTLDLPIAYPASTAVPPNIGLVVAPGNQTQPDIELPYLAWVDERSGGPQVQVMNMTNGTAFPVLPSPTGSRQRFPQLHHGLLVFAEGEAQLVDRCMDFCTVFFNTSTGERWYYRGPSAFAPATVDDRLVQADTSIMPGPASIQVRHAWNGTVISDDCCVEHDYTAWWDFPPLSGPVAGEDRIATSLRPYSDPHPICTDTWIGS
jgi:hypothetical protein